MNLSIQDFKAIWQGRPKCKPLCSDAKAIPKYTFAHRRGRHTLLLKHLFNVDYYSQKVLRFEQQFNTWLDDSVGKS